MKRMKHSNLSVIIVSVIAITFGGPLAYGDALSENFRAIDIHVKIAKPLSPADAYKKKFLSYQSAKEDHDFWRFVSLFEPCAKAGDTLCQYFLADGVSIWLAQRIVPHDRKYGPKFVRKWLRSSANDIEAYGFVTMNWSAYYFTGTLGFPRDKELYRCWREVANSNNDMNVKEVRGRFQKCKVLERRKWGTDAPWLS